MLHNMLDLCRVRARAHKRAHARTCLQVTADVRPLLAVLPPLIAARSLQLDVHLMHGHHSGISSSNNSCDFSSSSWGVRDAEVLDFACCLLVLRPQQGN
jgi:hypothetical protein